MLRGKSETLSGKRDEGRFAPHRRRRRLAEVLFAAISIALVVFLRIQIHHDSADPQFLARLDHPLPSLKVETRGTAVDLKHIIAGVRSVIVFYSPSCRTCREVLPALQPFPDSLRLILIKESAESADPEAFVFPNAAHFYDRWGVLTRFFAVAALPAILLVDEDGIVRGGIVGSHDPSFVRLKLKAFSGRTLDLMPEKH